MVLDRMEPIGHVVFEPTLTSDVLRAYNIATINAVNRWSQRSKQLVHQKGI